MWPGLVQLAKDGGVDAIETYVFWNGHELSPDNVCLSFLPSLIISLLKHTYHLLPILYSIVELLLIVFSLF